MLEHIYIDLFVKRDHQIFIGLVVSFCMHVSLKEKSLVLTDPVNEEINKHYYRVVKRLSLGTKLEQRPLNLSEYERPSS